MRVFVDECVTRLLLPHLIRHDFVHIRDTALRSARNGALLRAVAPAYDVFLTTDRPLYPQPAKPQEVRLVFVIMRGTTNDIADLLPLVPDTLAVLDRIAHGTTTPGDLFEIEVT